MIIQLLYKILQIITVLKKCKKKIPRAKACLMQTFILDIVVN